MEQNKIPQDWFCPISQEVMTDPVIGPDGYTYQRSFIEDWLQKSNTSPVTRKVMDSKNLIPNLALRSTIENMLPNYIEKGASTKLIQGEIKFLPEMVTDELELSVDTLVQGDELVVSVTVEPPSEQIVKNRKPVSIICVLDNSGSMGTLAAVEASGVEQNGFTRLDLVKHSINTIIHSLDNNDLLALVPFDDLASVALELTRMDKEGKEKAINALRQIQPQGSTNIWDGIRVGLDLSKNKQCDSRNTFVALLTDGEPNVNPPQGIVPTLKKFIDEQGLTCNLHVFGYGYNLDTVLLTEIATLGLGTYGYIPDCSMVGTIFINFLSNALANVTNLVQLQIQPAEGMKLLSTGGKTEPLKIIDLGGIQYGQKRTTLFRFALPTSDSKLLDIYLNFGLGLRKQKHFQLNKVQTRNKDELLSQVNRVTHIEALYKALNLSNKLPEARAVIDNALKVLENSEISNKDELTKLIIRDITSANQQEGQVSKALEKPEWFNKWGKHYLPALILAHSLQICTNFKDPGLQSYGGKLFRQLQNQIDTIFIKLPPPEPSARGESYVAPANMASYYNYGGGCIAGNCDVLMANHALKKVKDITKGDIVKTPNHASKVICVLKSKVDAKVDMIHFPRGLVITPFHPVKVDSQWQFPIATGIKVSQFVSQYYNFVLEEDHSMIVNGMECITLGHGFTGDVVSHEYLGTGKVIEDLKACNSWESGLVSVGEFVRDPVSQRITKMLVS